MMISGKRFGEEIGEIVSRRNFFDGDDVGL
jgi:hypothetical protein